MTDLDVLQLGAGSDGAVIGQSLHLSNRHGLIAGATGTGKTVTLQRLIEGFSDAGVTVFAADIKGDLCGLGAAGVPQGKIAERIASMPWLQHSPQAYPLTLWDVYGESGHPLRTTLTEMGPLLLGSLLELTDSMQAALYASFKIADQEGLLLLDLKDLKALLNHLCAHPELLGEDQALFSKASAQALLRRLATLEQQGGATLFGEPALQLEDILQPDADGRGRIHLLDASRLVTLLLGLVLTAYLVLHFVQGGTLTLDTVNWSFLALILLLVRNPFELIALTKNAASNVGEILLQFPLYAGILGLMTGSGLIQVFSDAFVAISNPVTFGLLAFLSAGLVNFFVPSGGGQFAVQGPIMLNAGAELGVDPAATVAVEDTHRGIASARAAGLAANSVPDARVADLAAATQHAAAGLCIVATARLNTTVRRCGVRGEPLGVGQCCHVARETIGGRAVDRDELGVPLAQLLQLGVDLGVVGRGLALADLEGRQVAELGGRTDTDLEAELERRARLGQVGLTDRDQLGGLDGGDEPLADRAAQRLVEHGLAAITTDDDRRRDLPLAEPRHAQVASKHLGGRKHRLLHSLRCHLCVDLDAGFGEFGDGRGDGGHNDRQR